MKNFITLITLLFCSSFLEINAQSKEDEKYKKESEEIRKQVWVWDKDAFKVKVIPAQYSSASKVIIATHTELIADSKSKFAFYGFGFGVKKEQKLTEIVRSMIKLNDKNAVDDYSELSFTRFQKTSGFYIVDKTTTYIGIRIIKPNGAIKEINADDIILTKDESALKKAKVAIPDLQPGDIIDYFIASEQSMANDFSTKPYHLFLFDNSPIMNLTFHAQLGKKYNIEYRSYNGAPDLMVSKNDEKDIIVDVEKINISPFETSFWIAYPQQLPFIRMNIAMGYKGLNSRMLDAKKPGEVSKNTESQAYLDEEASAFSSSYYGGYWMKAAKDEYDAIENDAKDKAKQMGTSFKNLSDEEKGALLYYTFRYSKILNFDINSLAKKIAIGENEYRGGLAFSLFCTMKAAKLSPAILISADRTGVRENELMNSNDLVSTAYLPEANKFFSIKTVYDIPFSIPQEIEGMKNNKSFTFDHPGMIMSVSKMEGLTNVKAGPNIPISTSDKNARIENLKIAIISEKNSLAINRSTTLKGFYKVDAQKQLILYEDFLESERKSFNDKMSLIETLEEDKKKRKYAEEVKNAFAEARKKQKDAFIKEAKDWFEQDITELKDYKTDVLGVRHTAPDFVYSSNFNISGLVKKAGNNIILEIGKIQGKPLVIKQEQRKRDLDIFMPFARSIEYNIEIQIPEGYVAEGISSLSKKVTNETGYFIVEANQTGNNILLKIKKHYLHNFESVGNWNKLLEFMDASNDFTNAKILFKKK